MFMIGYLVDIRHLPCLEKSFWLQTGFEITYQERRAHARQTWFPANAAEVERYAVMNTLACYVAY